jgi:hypothetical protein
MTIFPHSLHLARASAGLILLISILLSLERPSVTIASASSPCPYDFSLYVYPLPYRLIAKPEEARRNQTYHICRKCIYEQFALEYIVYDYFTQFCGRTYDPETADYFYLPIIREIDYRIGMHAKGGREPSLIEKTLLMAIEYNDTSPWLKNFEVTDKYWRRYQGSDHIIVMPAPVTNIRHQSNARGFFHYVSIPLISL